MKRHATTQKAFQLKAVHRHVCPGTKEIVANVARQGISTQSTGNGSRYEWGNSSEDPSTFALLGGNYSMCWCANMHDLTCAELQLNFWISAGTLEVVGPEWHEFECVRGSDCTLSPFRGVGLLVTDSVAVRPIACGGTRDLRLSRDNPFGIGSLAEVEGLEHAEEEHFILDFGSSNSESAMQLTLDSDDLGYFLCWCASARLKEDACQASHDFVVPAGILRVLGPRTNQERSCNVGQLCSLSNIEGVGTKKGDAIMILASCGHGDAIDGFPNGGIATTTDP